MITKVTNHAVKRYRERVSTDRLRDRRTNEEIRTIIRESFKKSEKYSTIEALLNQWHGLEINCQISLVDSEGIALGEYGFVLISIIAFTRKIRCNYRDR